MERALSAPAPAAGSRIGAALGLVGLILAIAPLAPIHARQSPFPGPADSAAAARQVHQLALAAFRGGNLKQAMLLADSAQRFWPVQPAYLSTLASMAARAGDTATAAFALERIARLGGVHPVDRDPAFAALASTPPVLRARAMLDANRVEQRHSTAEPPVGPPDFFAEGIAVAADGNWYLGSIRHRKVIRRDGQGRVADLTSARDGLWAVMGLALTPDETALWIATATLPQMTAYDSSLAGRSQLVRVDLAQGRVVQRVAIPGGARGATIGDILVAPDGTVYASDTRGQAIWALPAGGSVPRMVAQHPLIRSPQGLVLSRDGARLLVADYSHGIVSVHLASGEVGLLPSPPETTTTGSDGLVRYGRDLVAIQNGGVVPRVVRLRLDADERRIVAVEVLDRHLTVADEPTTGAVRGDQFYYIANSQWEKRREDGTPREGVTLHPTVVLRLGLQR